MRGATGRPVRYSVGMTTPVPLIEADEAQAARRRRIALEAELLAVARADIAAGLFVDEAEVDAWIDSIGTDHELPPPYPNR
jgi:hypothetical protein